MTEHFNTRLTLIAKLRNQHDEKSWEEFIHYYKKYIQVLILKDGVPRKDMDDLTQKVLLKLWKNLPDFNYQPHKCKFRSWMRVVVSNMVTSYFRNQGKLERDLERAELVHRNAENEIADQPDIDERIDEEWKLHISRLAWENIKDQFNGSVAECFQMFTRGNSVDEICEKLDIKRNSAFVFRQRVLDKLTKEIRRLDDELS